MPTNVTVTAVLAAALPDPSVSTMLDAPLAPQLAVATPLKVTLGVKPEAKKPDGYVSVILPPAVNAPPTVGVKENVADEPDFPATRSLGAIKNEAFIT